MANYAFVEDNTVIGVYDNLPKNWRNISNFNLLSDEFIVSLGWHRLIKVIPEHDPVLFKVGNPSYRFENGSAYEDFSLNEIIIEATPVLSPNVINPTEEEIQEHIRLELEEAWSRVRIERDNRMRDFEWRYSRYERQTRLSLVPTDDLTNLDTYMQALADITIQADPNSIVWPEYTE